MILTDEDIKQVYLDTFADDTPLTCTEWVAVRAIEAKVLKKMSAKHNEFESVLLQVRRALCGNIHGHDDIVELAASITTERDAALAEKTNAVVKWYDEVRDNREQITTLKSALREARSVLLAWAANNESQVTEEAIATINKVLGEE